MKVALIGAGEFVGARIIESFHLGEGPSLAAIARHPAELTSAARFAVDLRVADFLDVASLSRSFAGCSAAVYVARIAPDDTKPAIHALCRAAVEAGLRRLVFLSSADVHGLSPAIGTDEKSALNTRHGDEALNALVVAERQVLTESRQLGLAASALRAGFLYGPRSDAFFALATLLRDENAWLLQRGDGICNSLYVDNLVSAIRLALKPKAPVGSAFLLTDAETITWRDFYHTIAEELNVPTSSIRLVDEPEPAPGVLADLAARQRCAWKLPHARAAKELGYQPTVSVTDGIRRTCAWWRYAHGDFSAAA